MPASLILDGGYQDLAMLHGGGGYQGFSPATTCFGHGPIYGLLPSV